MNGKVVVGTNATLFLGDAVTISGNVQRSETCT
jgi:hypothetical protein